MKINYKNYPSLNISKTGDISRFIDQGLPANKLAIYSWEEMHLDKCNEVFYLSKSFIQCMAESLNKLPDIDISDMPATTGCYMHDNMCFFYSIDPDKNTASLFGFKGDSVAWFAVMKDNNLWGDVFGIMKNGMSSKEYLVRMAFVILKTILFFKYAEVETKILPPNAKTKGVSCDYGSVLNETQYKIKYITSNWFTTLIKSDQFKVRGHFRLQPCGASFKDKKLIWISDFVKEGYHRQADKLKIAG